jgi:hypothetical protein
VLSARLQPQFPEVQLLPFPLPYVYLSHHPLGRISNSRRAEQVSIQILRKLYSPQFGKYHTSIMKISTLVKTPLIYKVLNDSHQVSQRTPEANLYLFNLFVWFFMFPDSRKTEQ